MAATKDRKTIADEHPDVWIPVDVGDVIDGEVVDVTEAWSDPRAAFYPLLTVKTDLNNGQELKVHALGTVLYNEIMRQRPVVGDRITITFLGTDDSKRPPAGRSLPIRYRVRVHGRDPVAQAERVYARIESGAPGRAQPGGDVPTVTGDEDVPF